MRVISACVAQSLFYYCRTHVRPPFHFTLNAPLSDHPQHARSKKTAKKSAQAKPTKSFAESLLETETKLRGSVESSDVRVADTANYAWILSKVSKVSEHGVVGFVLVNGSISTNTKGEGAIRQKIVENYLVDCMIALSLFRSLMRFSFHPSLN